MKKSGGMNTPELKKMKSMCSPSKRPAATVGGKGKKR